MKLSMQHFAGFIALPLMMGMTFTASAESHGSAGPGISVEDSYVRVVPPGQKNTGAFMTIHNSSDKARSITSAESDAAEIVELHTHVNEDGMMKMRQIEKIDVPAMGKTVLMPGGLHVMLIGLTEAIEEGKAVRITLVFADGERKEIEATGRMLQMKMMHKGMDDSKMDHSKMQHNMH
jgi:copper(I)-binding protein